MNIDDATIREWHQRQLDGRLDLSGLLAKEPQLPVDLIRFLLNAAGETADWGTDFLTLLPPSTAAQLIRTAEDEAFRPVLYCIARALRGWDIVERREAFMRWLDSPDPEVARQALSQLPAIPMPAWAQEIYMHMASRPGHPLRYDAMLLINAGMIPRPRFDAALSDSDAKIRSAAYCNLAIHGGLTDLLRLAEGMGDPNPEVREAVLGCLVEIVVGSDIDKRPPLLERKWKQAEGKVARRLRGTLEAGFRRAVVRERGEAQNHARVGLAMLSKPPAKKRRKPAATRKNTRGRAKMKTHPRR